MTASRKNAHRAVKRRPEVNGSWFRVCARCDSDSDHLDVGFRLSNACPFIRGEWLCTYCFDAHRTNCPTCKELIKR